MSEHQLKKTLQFDQPSLLFHDGINSTSSLFLYLFLSITRSPFLTIDVIAVVCLCISLIVDYKTPPLLMVRGYSPQYLALGFALLTLHFGHYCVISSHIVITGLL